ncbi:MAG TPA: ABC transporter permease subunit [Euzebyales bacterium]|nr:ABC transporter permease subunit [Euzebyales bacterium]
MTSLRAELLKLRKRPAVWILSLAMLLVVGLFGYVFLYTVVTQMPPEASAGMDRLLILETVSPANLPGHVLSMVASFGTAFGLILGALAVGSEFNWHTVKTIATQGPRRVALMAGRSGALLIVALTMALMAFAGGAAGTWAITLLEPIDATPPAAAEFAGAVGAAVLIIALWCAIGAMLAMVLRGTGWAIGIGLLYALVVEQVLGGLVPLRGRAGELLDQALIGNNVTALVSWLSSEASQAMVGATVEIAPLQAALVLAGYLALAVAVATVVFVRRDIA